MKLGDIRKFRVIHGSQGQQYDITDAVIGAKVFQSMLEPTWTAQIYIMDSADLMSSLKIGLGSYIKILAETKHGVSTDGNKEFTFFIYRVGDKETQNQKNMTYTLYCSTDDFLMNKWAKVNKKYTNMKMTDAVKLCCQEYLSKDIIVNGTACENSSTLIVPNWSVFNSIGWMIKTATYNGNADYLFFQKDNSSEKNEYMMESIAQCWKKMSSLEVLKMRPANVKNPNPLDVYNITKYQELQSDVQSNLTTGYYANTLKTFDFRKKKMSTNIVKNMEKSENPLVDKIQNAENSKVTFKAQMSGVNGEHGSPNDDAHVWHQTRFKCLQELEQNRLLAQIPGTIGVWQWLGGCINVDVPSQDATQDKIIYDPRMKGKYLVRSIVHNFNRQTYTINMELIKQPQAQTQGVRK